MVEESLATIDELITHSQAHIVLNPSRLQCQQEIEVNAEIFKRAYALIINQGEACLLLGKHPEEVVEMNTLLIIFYEHLKSIVVITDATQGAYAFDGKFIYSARPRVDLNIVEIKDAFSATFVAALIKGWDLAKAMELAMPNAESVLEHEGAKNKLFTFEQAK